MRFPKTSQGYGAQNRAVEYQSVIPNPKLKLLDQVREVMRLKHYSIRTERRWIAALEGPVGFRVERQNSTLAR